MTPWRELTKAEEEACRSAIKAAHPHLNGLPMVVLCEFTARLAAIPLCQQPSLLQMQDLADEIMQRALSIAYDAETERTGIC